MSKRAKKKGSTSPEKTKQTLESLTEDRLRNSVLIPLFEAMGFRDVFHHHGGALEQGKDITMWKPGDLEERVNYAVVVKRGDVTGKAAGKQGAGEVETQIRQCFGSPFKDPITSEDRDVDRCWVVASGKISKEALNAIQISLKGTNYQSVTRFIDGKQLAKLIRQHMPGKTLWDHVEDVRNTAAKVDSGYSISLGISEDKTVIGILAKNPSTEPPSLQFKLRFTDDAVGKKAHADFVKFLKTGGPLKLDPSQIGEVTLPEVMKKLIGASKHHAYGFEFVPNVGNTVPFRFIAQTDTGEIARLELVELRCVRAGTEEVFLTNEHQTFPARIEVLMNGADKRLNVQFASQCSGHNVVPVAEWLHFQKALSQPGIVTIEHMGTGVELARHRTNAVLPSPNDVALEMADALAFIQRKTHTLFEWPDVITADQQNEILQVVDILKTGRCLLKSMGVTLVQQAFSGQPTNAKRIGAFQWHSDGDHVATILEVPVNLGPAEINCDAVEIAPVRKEKDQLASHSSEQDPVTEGVVTAAEGKTLQMVFSKWSPIPA